MARIARAVAPGFPHHITQRGNRRQQTFLMMIKGKDDILVRTKPLLATVHTPWRRFLSTDANEQQIEILRKHERTGRPLGEDAFIEKLESLLDRKLKRQKPGPQKDK